ncbi:MAG TPA: class I SAM-dependent methyltransferase [Flavobacteriales bacterium]|jgi:predicted O-methyltransferase YrrM|nr:class I SAM-dependent methyltransferase [Flavobacteriales bacterium]HOY28701.1 class I SAM-dependent methyltransferase [Flavobacteriales bacterium]
MGDHLRQIGSYLGHLVKARNRHGVHSPFVYELITQVLRSGGDRPEFTAIEQARTELLVSEQTIRVNDLGAGSRVFDLPVRRVSDITRSAVKAPRQAQLLFRLARYLDAGTVVELGTSFGISTLYLARGAENGVVHTIEGCPQTYRIAQHHFELLEQRNIEPLLGSFRKRLPEVLEQLDALDLVFLDGHHAKEPTLEYFDLCLQRSHNDTVLVLDDIHWSRGMEEAWIAIKGHPRVTVTIDLYSMGLVFLRTEQAKEHFVLRY